MLILSLLCFGAYLHLIRIVESSNNTISQPRRRMVAPRQAIDSLFVIFASSLFTTPPYFSRHIADADYFEMPLIVAKQNESRDVDAVSAINGMEMPRRYTVSL